MAEREHSKLLFDERLDAWAKDANFILGRELRHTIERISPEASKPAVVSEPAAAEPPAEPPPGSDPQA